MPIRVAILSSHGFGDGLIQLAVGHNLQINGFAVVYYSDFIFQLRDYIQGVEVRAFPDYDQAKEELEGFDFILYDANSKFVGGLPAELENWLTKNAIAYSLSRSPPRHRSVSVEQLKARCSPEAAPLAERFIRLNRKFRGAKLTFSGRSMGEHLVKEVTRLLALKHVSHDCCVVVGGTGQKESQLRRVVIHPTSSNVHKNWSPEQFLELAVWLKSSGWQPVFTLSPPELAEWQNIVGDQAEVQSFQNIAQLAEFYADSALFVGNDSGNAHLASCLGVPSIVIFNRWRRNPIWRPCWGMIKVIYPSRPSKNWRRFVNVDRLIFAIRELTDAGRGR